MFDNPEEHIRGCDREVIRELNNRLADDPEYEVPKGYVKKLKKTLVFNYSLPETLPIDESYRVSYEYLDSLVNNLFGFHMIEPLSELYLEAHAVPAKKEDAKSVFLDVDRWMKKRENNKIQKNKISKKSFKVGNFMPKISKQALNKY